MINKNIYFIIGAFIFLVLSRIIPHPPNYNSSIVLALYLPCIFGKRYVMLPILGFAIADIFIGLHEFLIFTWGSIFLISLLSKYYTSTISRTFGILSSCLIFYFISNFGVWLVSGYYSHNIEGLIKCYTLALPFLKNSLLGNLLFALFLEYFVSSKKCSKKIKYTNPNWKAN